MAKQLAGEILILGAKQSCIGYLLRLRIKIKHLSVKTFTWERLEKSEGEAVAREAADSYSRDDQNTGPMLWADHKRCKEQ